MMKVLNVGGGPTRQLPPQYDGWKQCLLDIDPATNPDLCLDARELCTLDANQFDAVYCSHNLEHYYKHEVPVVLKGFHHVLKEGGFVDVSVPNIRGLCSAMIASNLDINDVWYRTGQGVPITFHDVMFGWGLQVEFGNPWYAHKTAFTPLSLSEAFSRAGFAEVIVSDQGSNLFAKATKSCPQP
jgi:hypothetical protein